MIKRGVGQKHGRGKTEVRKIFLILDNVRSAHNIGSVFRTADAAGVSKIFLCGITPDPDRAGPRARRDISKTALGAEAYIPWEYHSQTARLIGRLKKQDVCVVALEQTKNAIPYRNFGAKFPLALIVGNEVRGVSKTALKRADSIVFIPMFGKKESLNVAVACGIALFALQK